MCSRHRAEYQGKTLGSRNRDLGLDSMGFM